MDWLLFAVAWFVGVSGWGGGNCCVVGCSSVEYLAICWGPEEEGRDICHGVMDDTVKEVMSNGFCQGGWCWLFEEGYIYSSQAQLGLGSL